jgi:uncharacterized RDD family membrane protein YckC
MKNITSFLLWLRTISILIDLVFISSISLLTKLLVLQFSDIHFLSLFLIIFPLYYLICYWFLNGCTLAKIITGIQVVSEDSNELNKWQLLIREISKLIFLFIIPFYFIKQFSFPISPLLLYGSIGFMLFLVILAIAFPLFFNKTWWDYISATTTIKSKIISKAWKVKSEIILVCIFAITIFFKTFPFIINSENIKQEFYPKYPDNLAVEECENYILANSQNPVDYVFGLFEKYDLVVLCERMHSEYTQYQLISEIITDKRFVEKVGNIYTECGSRSFQDTLDNYLRTDFKNVDLLDKATAILQRNSNSVWPLWTNTNLFDLLKTVNNQNANLPDSLKTNWHFTDIQTNWQTITPLNYQKHKRSVRDDEMANRIYAKYKDICSTNKSRKKGLVIMNFRHGFGHMSVKQEIKIDHSFKSINAAAILMDSLPGKVCNVMLNTISLKCGYLYTPIQKGKWDRAFSELKNPNIGFDFADSPFGQDQFDLFIGNTVNGLKYQDVFTGFIFYKPLREHILKTGFPYMLYNFEDSLIRRAECVSSDYAEKWKTQIKNYKANETCNGYIKHSSLVNLCNGKAEYATLYNLIINIGFSIITFFTLIMTILFFRFTMKSTI